MRSVPRALLLGAALAGGGCGGDPDEAAATPTRLVVEVRPEGAGGPVRTSTMECAPGAADPTCRRLARTAPGAFGPLPADTVCTEIFGGPATATVRGSLRSERIDATFSLTNGCEIDRWRRFEWLLGPIPGFPAP